MGITSSKVESHSDENLMRKLAKEFRENSEAARLEMMEMIGSRWLPVGDITASTGSIAVATSCGGRDYQQDVIFAGTVASETFRLDKECLGEVVEHYKDYRACGSTLCCVTATPLDEESVKAGKVFPCLRIANLGDSEAKLVMKIREESGRVSYQSVSLNQSMRLSDKRVASKIAHEIEPGKSGRLYAKNDVRRMIAMGGSIGDGSFDGLIRTPDFYDLDPNDLLRMMKKTGTIEAAHLVLASDGIFYDIPRSGEEFFGCDYELVINEKTSSCGGVALEEVKFQKSKKPYLFSLSNFRRIFDESAGAAESKNFSAALRCLVCHDNPTSDNVSVITADLSAIRQKSIFIVCDGHGNTDLETAIRPSPHAIFTPVISTGGQIAADIVANISARANLQMISGLEALDGQRWLREMRASRFLPRQVVGSPEANPAQTHTHSESHG